MGDGATDLLNTQFSAEISTKTHRRISVVQILLCSRRDGSHAQRLCHGASQIRWAFGHHYAACTQCVHLRLRGVECATDDCAGVAHAFAFWRGAAGDKCSDRFFHVLLNPQARVTFILTTNFTDHDYAFGFLIRVEHAQRVDKVQALDRIAADANASALTNSKNACLPDCFVGKRAAATDDSNCAAGACVTSMRVDVARHDSNFASTDKSFSIRQALAWRNHAGTIGADQRDMWKVIIQLPARSHHVLHRNAFGDATNNANTRVGCLQN